MLRIYPVILETISKLRTVVAQIERRDRDLARQLRRAGSSISLNVAEGMYSRGALRQARYHTALGSAREVLACLETARAWGYVARVEPELAAALDAIIGTLVRLVAVGQAGQALCAAGLRLAKSFVPRDRIELPTRGFSIRCSTN